MTTRSALATADHAGTTGGEAIPARGREARSLHHRRLCVAVACGSPSGSSERKPISTPTPATSPRAHNCTGGIHIRLDGAGSRAQQISGAVEQLRSSPASGIRPSQTPPSRITLERGAGGGDVRGDVGGAAGCQIGTAGHAIVVSSARLLYHPKVWNGLMSTTSMRTGHSRSTGKPVTSSSTPA